MSTTAAADGESILEGTGHISCDLHSSVVVFSKLSSSYPLKLLSPRVSKPGVGIVYVMSYGGGLVGGDCVHLVVEIGRACKLLLLSQGSTKVFKTRSGGRASTHLRRSSSNSNSNSPQTATTQSIEITIEPDSGLFLLPDPVTCFRSASYTQVQTFHLAESASIVLLDWITSGRRSLGEDWDFQRYHSINEVFVEGRRVARDVLLLDNPFLEIPTTSCSSPPCGQPLRTLKDRLLPYSCYAMLLLYGPQTHRVANDLQAKYQSISVFKCAAPDRFLWSLSPVDDRKGTVIRAAGVETEDVKRWFRESLKGLEAVVGIDEYQIYKQSGNLASFSPGAHFIFNVVENTLIVRRTDTLRITRTWTIVAPSTTATISSNLAGPADGWISHAGWSCDSEYIFAASAKKGIVEVFKLRDEAWNARIEAGAEGLLKAEWAPDGRHILCFSQWGLRVTIWSLVSGNATYIQFPIHPDRGYAFRYDSRYFVLAERHKSKDTIGVYDTADFYRLVRHFPIPTSNLSSLALCPTGNHIAVWEGILEYKLHIISLAGVMQGSFAPEPDPGFGIRNVSWHPTGMFIAVAGWDDKIHICDGLTWSAVATLELSSKIPTCATLWREPSNWHEATQGRGFLSYERLPGLHTISIQRTDPTKSNPKSGVVQLDWNKTGTLLLVRFENCPTVVHLYDFPAPSDPFVPRLRCVLQHSKPVLHAQWNPVRKGSLALCCGSGSIYTWSDEWSGENGVEEDMAECIGVPASTNFETRDIKWAPDGKGLVLLDKEMFCCAFEVEDGAGAESSY